MRSEYIPLVSCWLLPRVKVIAVKEFPVKVLLRCPVLKINAL